MSTAALQRIPGSGRHFRAGDFRCGTPSRSAREDRMRRVWVMAAIVLAASAAYGQAQFVNSDGSRTQGTVVECLEGALVEPCGTTTSPLETDQGTPGTGIN